MKEGFQVDKSGMLWSENAPGYGAGRFGLRQRYGGNVSKYDAASKGGKGKISAFIEIRLWQ